MNLSCKCCTCKPRSYLRFLRVHVEINKRTIQHWCVNIRANCQQKTEVTNAHPIGYDNDVGKKTWVLLIIRLQEDAFAGVQMQSDRVHVWEESSRPWWLSVHVDLPACQSWWGQALSLRWKGEAPVPPHAFSACGGTKRKIGAKRFFFLNKIDLFICI